MATTLRQNVLLLTRILKHLEYGEIGGFLHSLGLSTDWDVGLHKGLVWTRGRLALSRELARFDWETVTEETLWSKDRRELVVVCATRLRQNYSLGLTAKNGIYYSLGLSLECFEQEPGGTVIVGQFVGYGANPQALVWCDSSHNWVRPTRQICAFSSWFGHVPVATQPLFLKFVVS